MPCVRVERTHSRLQSDTSTELVYKAEINRDLKSLSIIITLFHILYKYYNKNFLKSQKFLFFIFKSEKLFLNLKLQLSESN